MNNQVWDFENQNGDNYYFTVNDSLLEIQINYYQGGFGIILQNSVENIVDAEEDYKSYDELIIGFNNLKKQFSNYISNNLCLPKLEDFKKNLKEL